MVWNVWTYLHQHLAILLDRLVCILDFLLLLGFDGHVEIDLDLLVLETRVECVRSARAR